MHFLINSEMINESFIDSVIHGNFAFGYRDLSHFVAKTDIGNPMRIHTQGCAPDVFLITLKDGRVMLLPQMGSNGGEYECIDAWMKEKQEETVKCSKYYLPPPTQPKPAPLSELSEEEKYQARIKTLEKQLDF